MAFSKNTPSDEVMSEINVTPLVDVMLVLLIVFMITMPILTHSIPINLPSTHQTQPQNTPTEPLRLSIDAAGDYYLGENKTSLDELTHIFIDAKQKNGDIVLAIDADKSVDYNSVVQALNLAKNAGISKIGFVTTPD